MSQERVSGFPEKGLTSGEVASHSKISQGPQHAMVVANCLLFFLHSKISFAFRGGGRFALSKPHKVMLSKTPFSPRVCPKQENLLFVVSFANGVSSAEACHGTAHNMYYIIICTCGILICRILANEVCDLQCLCHVAAKGTSSDIILHPLMQNTSNPVRCAGRQLSHGNLNFAAESSSCNPHLSLETIC